MTYGLAIAVEAYQNADGKCKQQFSQERGGRRFMTEVRINNVAVLIDRVLSWGFMRGAASDEPFLFPRMISFSLPPGYDRIQRVQSFHELVTTPLQNGVNALCWPRLLEGDYGEVVRHLEVREGIRALDLDQLQALPVSAAGRVAVEQLLADLRLLREQGLSPELNCIRAYPRDEEPGPVPTDVFSFHADSATMEADTYLCTYFGPASEGLRHEEARRRVEMPETRAELLRDFGGEDDEGFSEWLHENCYDLHYAALPGAVPFGFGLFNLWRIAVDYPGSPVPPCIHRAPETLPGDPPRLLLIS